MQHLNGYYWKRLLLLWTIPIQKCCLSGSMAIKTNAIKTYKIESKKLKIWSHKCFDIYIEKIKDNHKNSKVHSEILNVKEYKTYKHQFLVFTSYYLSFLEFKQTSNGKIS